MSILNEPHPRIDLSEWKLRWNQKPLLGIPVRSPLGLLAFDRWRSEVLQSGLVCKKPIDLVFWSSNAALHPALTRVGGIPYRDKTKAWPKGDNGNPLTFIGQYNFCDSRDLLPNLPGDILLYFAKDLKLTNGGPDDRDYQVYCEWQQIAEVKSPLLEDDCPPPSFRVPQLSGVLHRYFDYDYDYQNRDRLNREFANATGRLSSRWNEFLSIPCSKIGNTYFEVQQGWDPREWYAEDSLDWQVVGTFYSIYATGDNWPLVDRKNVAESEAQGLEFLFKGDPGHLVLLSASSGGATSCYISG